MRSIPLVSTVINVPTLPADSPFVYGDVLRLVLLSAPTGGIGTDEGLQASDIAMAVRAAASRGANDVLFEETDWQFLCKRLGVFRWNVWDDCCADFVRAVREAPKIDPVLVTVPPAAVAGA